MHRGALAYLRERLLFDGVIVTDCLEMGAIVKHYTVPEAAVLAVLAGVDMLLICHTEARQVAAIDAIAEAVLGGRLALSAVKQAGQRISQLARTYYRPPPPAGNAYEEGYALAKLRRVGCKEHRDIAANITHQAAVNQARHEGRLRADIAREL
eukprot:jgi/Mesen1/482/ME001024S10723